MISGVDLLIGSAPAVGWLFWIRRKDRCEPEPWRVVIGVFLLGTVAALATVWLRPRIESLVITRPPQEWARWLDAFVVTAFVEEALKFAAFSLGALWCSEWDEPLDGVVYGAAAGLGFSAIENAFFVWATGEPELAIARGFTATLAHVAFSGGLGLFVGLARLRWRGRRWTWAAIGALAAVTAHGAYDAFSANGSSGRVALFSGLVVLVAAIAVAIRWAHHRSSQCEA